MAIIPNILKCISLIIFCNLTFCSESVVGDVVLINYTALKKINPNLTFLQTIILKPQFTGLPKHTGYPNLPMDVLCQMAFSGKRGGGYRTQMIIFQTTQNQRNFILMEK